MLRTIHNLFSFILGRDNKKKKKKSLIIWLNILDEVFLNRYL